MSDAKIQCQSEKYSSDQPDCECGLSLHFIINAAKGLPSSLQRLILLGNFSPM